MIGYRHYWIETGEKIMLRVEPVDPRDLFRGDYVSLSYEISSLDRSSYFEKIITC
jgi:uncharacterized membrane-anchored protein